MDAEERAVRLASEAISLVRGEAVRRMARRGALVGVALAVAFPTTGEAFLFSDFPFVGTSFLLLVASGLAALVAYVGWPFVAPPRAGTLELRGVLLDVRCGETPLVHLEEVEQGGFREPDCLVLRTRRGLELHVRAARRDAGDLLDRAGLSVSQRVLRVRLASTVSDRRAGSAVAVLGVALVAVPTFMAVLIAIFLVEEALRIGLPHTEHRLLVDAAWFFGSVAAAAVGGLALRTLLSLLRQRDVVVGADGVLLEARGRRRFVPYARMTGASRSPRGVALALRDASQLELPVQGTTASPLPDGPLAASTSARAREALDRRELLLSRIQDAISSAPRAGAASALDVLDRKGRPVDVWCDDLCARALKSATYRDADLTADELLGVVVDGDAPPERRVAAALVVSASGDGERRPDLHAAARACADDDLRAAIEAAAGGGLDEAALARIQDRRLL